MSQLEPDTTAPDKYELPAIVKGIEFGMSLLLKFIRPQSKSLEWVCWAVASRSQVYILDTEAGKWTPGMLMHYRGRAILCAPGNSINTGGAWTVQPTHNSCTEQLLLLPENKFSVIIIWFKDKDFTWRFLIDIAESKMPLQKKVFLNQFILLVEKVHPCFH